MSRVATLAAGFLALAAMSAHAQQPAPETKPPAAVESADPRIDVDRCTQLRQEHIKVLQSGIVQDMQRGPEWAKFHLSKERLGEIEKYIALEEQLKFNCREANLLIDLKSLMPPAVPANASDDDAAAPAGAAAEGAAQPKPKKSQKKKPKQPAAAGTGAELVWPGLSP